MGQANSRYQKVLAEWGRGGPHWAARVGRVSAKSVFTKGRVWARGHLQSLCVQSCPAFRYGKLGK